MNIALIGYGKMGKIVEQIALQYGHSIIGIIDSQRMDQSSLLNADVCIDFSRPDQVIHNIKIVAALGKDIVMGTTGWYDQLSEVREIIENSHIGFVYAANFSIGIALYLNFIRHAATKINNLYEYDVSGVEVHHEQKLDSPSGTAKGIIQLLETHMPRKKGKINIASERVGDAPGTHSILFDSPADTITLTHTARNREGFATGALKAAEWVHNKKGFFHFNDVLEAIHGNF